MFIKIFRIINDNKISGTTYNYISDFNDEGIAIVYIMKDKETVNVISKDMYGLINEGGKLILKLEYNYVIKDNYCDCFRVFKGKVIQNEMGESFPKDGKWWLLNAKGEFVNNKTYELIGEFYNDIALIKLKSNKRRFQK